jgi:hypothetical protein
MNAETKTAPASQKLRTIIEDLDQAVAEAKDLTDATGWRLHDLLEMAWAVAEANYRLLYGRESGYGPKPEEFHRLNERARRVL